MLPDKCGNISNILEQEHTSTHIHTHTRVHTYTRAHTHTYTHTHIQSHTHTHTCTQLQAFPNPQVRYTAQPHLGGQVMFNVAPQGGVAMTGGATPIPISGGGVPLQNIHSTTQPALLSGQGVTQTQQLPQAQGEFV